MSDDTIRKVIENLGFDGGDSEEILEALEAADFVVSRRPRYEALMAVAEASAALEAEVRRSAWPPDWFKSMAIMAEALAALRAAGVDLEEK